MVIKRWKATLPQARLGGSRGTSTMPKGSGRKVTFSGNSGTGGRGK